MPQPPVKNKKAKPEKIKLVAKNPRPMKAAIKAWVASSEKTDCDPLNMNGAPAWAEKALAEGVKIILPSQKLPTKGECDPEFIGELVGRQQALARLFCGEIPMGAEMQTDVEQIMKHAAALPKTPALAVKIKSIERDLANMMNANDQAIPALMAAALGSSHQDSLKFQRGLIRGMNLVGEELESGKIMQRNTQVFLELGLHWRNYYRCRSVAEVHRKLCAGMGEKNVCTLKHFEGRVAKKIGMKFGPAGCPPKAK